MNAQVPQQPKRTAGLAAALALLLSMLGYFEGTRLVAYRDIAGVLTICTGETHNVYEGERATVEQCRDMTMFEALHFLSVVDDAMKDHPPPARWAALADFAYNVGPTAFRNSSALRWLNAGAIVRGCDALLRYDKVRVHGVLRVSQWQRKRRLRERELCLSEGTS